MRNRRYLTLITVLLLCGFSQNGLTSTPMTVQYQIFGIQGDACNNILAKLKFEQYAASPTTASEVNEFYGTIILPIKVALRPFGFFKAAIHTQLFRINETTWRIHIDVVPGPATMVRSVTINIKGEGQNDATFRTFRKTIALKAGHRFTVADYEKTKQALLSLGISRGYLKAQLISHSVKIDLPNNATDILLEYDTGPRFHFGSVSFSPNPFKTSFLNRFIPFKINQAYTTPDLTALQDRLSSSGYFQQVLVQPDISKSQNSTVPISVFLTPRKAHQYNLGIGYGTDTGPRGTFEWNWRRVTSTGHRFNTTLQVSPVQNYLQALYIIPGKDPLADQYSLNTTVFTNEFKEGNSRAYQLGGAYVKTKNVWKQTISLNYQFGHFQLTGQDPQHSHFLLPGISWQRMEGDDPLFPKNGSKLTINFQGSSKNVLAETSFIQGAIQGKGIYSPTDASRFVARMDLGYTSVEDLSVLPPNLRFFAGGSQSIRGFEYQALGPGRYLGVASIEYQHRIIDRWYSAAFYDAGNAFNKFTDPMQRGAGIGIVWASPVGRLELTLAKALTQAGRPLKVQFAMGTDL